ncbi:hypothetical protein [Lyngbya aestuarii]
MELINLNLASAMQAWLKNLCVVKQDPIGKNTSEVTLKPQRIVP